MMSKTMLHPNKHLFVLCLAVSLLAGCAHTQPLNMDAIPHAPRKALVQPWPLTVGLYIPPSIRSREAVRVSNSQSGFLHSNVPLGEDAASTFRWMLEQMFTKVVTLEDPPDKTKLNGLAGVIELSEISIGSYVLIYETSLYSRKGEKIDVWETASPIRSESADLAYVISDILAQFMVKATDRPAVKNWLAAEGVGMTAVQPYFQHEGSEQPSTSNILLAPYVSTEEGEQAISCLGNRLAHLDPPFNLIDNRSARLDFFPWLEPSLLPKSSDDLQLWLARPGIQMMLQLMGVRYLLEFHGQTKTDMATNGILCGAGFGAGGCFGYSSGTRDSSFRAIIHEVRDAGTPAELSVTKRGGVYIPAFILPIPFIAMTETQACDQLAGQIHEMVTRPQ